MLRLWKPWVEQGQRLNAHGSSIAVTYLVKMRDSGYYRCLNTLTEATDRNYTTVLKWTSGSTTATQTTMVLAAIDSAKRVNWTLSGHAAF